jgi:hypothetical protein
MPSISTAALVVAGVGAAVSAAGAISGGIAAGNEANYQSQVAKNNAQIAQQKAQYATASGEANAAATSMKGRAQIGAIKAAEAANNVDVNSGSASAVRTGQRETNQLDTLTVMNRALLQDYGYQAQASNFSAQAGLDETAAEEAPIAGGLNAAGGLLSSASALGGKWTSPSTGIPVAHRQRTSVVIRARRTRWRPR